MHQNMTQTLQVADKPNLIHRKQKNINWTHKKAYLMTRSKDKLKYPLWHDGK
jgi:hypothetical protein